jgi:hypothetical protein
VSLTVLWQSAKPIQDAHPLALPPKLENHYVLAVTGIPSPVINAAMMGDRPRFGGRGGSGGGGREFGGGREGGGGRPDGAGASAPPPAPVAGNEPGSQPGPPPDPTAPLKRGASLTVKGKAPQNADVVMSMNNNAVIFFGFAKDALALSVGDKEVEFDIKVGGLTAKVKFNLKEMLYHEDLAL